MRIKRNQRGIALAWTALVLLIMVGVVGLSIDWGWATVDASSLQNAADAAALAGALKVKTGFHDASNVAYEAAWALSNANYAAGAPVDVYYDATTNDPTLDVVVGRWFPATPTTAAYFEALTPASGDAPNAVKVVTRHVQGWHDVDHPINRPLALNFGPIFGQPNANVSREAIAISAGGGGAALVCLYPYSDKPGLDLTGGGKVNVMAGSVPGEVYVNSDDVDYAVMPGSNSPPDQGQWYIKCAGMTVCGTVDPLIDRYYVGNGIYPILQNVPAPMPDPLAGVPDVPAQTLATLVKKDAAGNVIATHDVYNPIDEKVVQDFGVAEVDPISGNPVLDPTGKPYWTLTINPGFWPGGIQFSSGGFAAYTAKVKLNPGIYAFGGGPKVTGSGPKNPVNGAYVCSGASGLDLNGGTVEGFEVMIYLTMSQLDPANNNSKCVWAQVNQHGGSGTLRVTEIPLGSGSAWAGLVLFQDRSNPSEAFIGGGSNNNILQGTLYFHNKVGVPDYQTLLHLQGSAGNIGIQVITDRLAVSGTAEVIIAYDGRGFQPACQSFLVK